MISTNFVALIGFAYIFLLFLIAYFGDRDSLKAGKLYKGNYVYALSLAVYCSSWTFYGAVGTAAVDGLDYLAIYLGPCLVFLFGYPVVRRIIMICKQNNITSISDFLSSRYGKSRRIATLVTLIAVAGSLPYIALQLKAVSSSYFIMSGSPNNLNSDSFFADNIALIVAAGLVVFTILFGTRHLDTTEHHKGITLAIAFESIVKLIAILAVGYFAVYLLFDEGTYTIFGDYFDRQKSLSEIGQGGSTIASFTTKLLLSMAAIILLPRQFQVTVVEAKDHTQFKTAMWVMPIYLVLTSIIVIPITLSGMELLPNLQEDFYVLSLPITGGNTTLGLPAFIGGLSAATGMVIVASISLSTMICNDLIMPFLIKRKGIEFLKRERLDNLILLIRRAAIFVLMLGAYGYFRLIDSNQQLANIGLVSFAAIAQLLPATMFALFWRRAHSKGIFWGLIGGSLVWIYTLLLPTILPSGSIDTFFGDSIFHPQKLFGFNLENSLTHGVIWSLSINILLLIFFSFRESQPVIEKLQASRFFFVSDQEEESKTSNALGKNYEVSPDELAIVAERIIGVRSCRALFLQYEQRSGLDLSKQTQADLGLISAVQTAIAGVIGTTSAQRVISDSLLGDDVFLGELTHLVDETTSVLQFNRNLLQTTLENITNGIAVVDKNLNLVIWNDNYLKMFGYPESLFYIGKPIKEVLEYSAERGDFFDKDPNAEITKRIRYLEQKSSYTTTRETASGAIIKATGKPMPDGGFVTTYEDITKSVKAAALLRKANEELEFRVQERTSELEKITQELKQITRSKTHFLAAASHDLLQPINAARLFTHSISERSEDSIEVKNLSKSIDKSLVTADELLRALLDISKLDAGGIEPDYKILSVEDFLYNVESEMKASAIDKGIHLSVDTESLFVISDRQLLFSVVLNLVANAIRYTPEKGKVIIRSSKGESGLVDITVEDSGLGIEHDHLEAIFTEFYQVKDRNRRNNQGLGLGLSIVKRICALLEIGIDVKSEVGTGSIFKLSLPESQSKPVVKSPRTTKTETTITKLAGINVLCLDNDESVLAGMQTMIEYWGCKVVCSLNYQDAINQSEDMVFDIVLADYRLDDDETGLDFLKYRQTKDTSLKGVLITAEQDKLLKPKVEKQGFSYLAKPVEPASLKSLMMYLVSKD